MDRDPRMIQLIMDLRGKGIANDAVLSAMELAPRHGFVPDHLSGRAYEDEALPIEAGQTISQPYIVAFMLQAADIQPEHKVLEVGTGSGYQAAVLSHICRRVYTVERQSTLFRTAQKRLAGLGLSNVVCVFGDGARGWQVQAPFDRIVVAAATTDPSDLLAQLAEGGVMVAPIGAVGAVQTLTRFTKTADGVQTEELLPVRFVPLVGGVSRDG